MKGEKSEDHVWKKYPSNQSRLDYILNNFIIDKTSFRVPRAPNLLILIRIFLCIQNGQNIKELMLLSKIDKRSYFIEYLKLLVKLGWASYKGDYIMLTDQGNFIASNLGKDEHLSENDYNIIKRDFLKLPFIKKFLLKIFHFDINAQRPFSGVCLTKDDITKKYQNYRKLSRSVAERESRLIYNWLVELEVLEALPIRNKYFENKVCYHIVEGDVRFDSFANKIRPTILKVIKSERKTSVWVDIPKIRYILCVENDIRKSAFDELFRLYIKKYPQSFQLATATALRPEVEREGIESNNGTIYFYVRPSEDL